MKSENVNTLLLPQYLQQDKTDDEKLVSKFSLIDLAGSERHGKTGENLRLLKRTSHKGDTHKKVVK